MTSKIVSNSHNQFEAVAVFFLLAFTYLASLMMVCLDVFPWERIAPNLDGHLHLNVISRMLKWSSTTCFFHTNDVLGSRCIRLGREWRLCLLRGLIIHGFTQVFRLLFFRRQKMDAVLDTRPHNPFINSCYGAFLGGKNSASATRTRHY